MLSLDLERDLVSWGINLVTPEASNCPWCNGSNREGSSQGSGNVSTPCTTPGIAPGGTGNVLGNRTRCWSHGCNGGRDGGLGCDGGQSGGGRSGPSVDTDVTLCSVSVGVGDISDLFFK